MYWDENIYYIVYKEIYLVRTKIKSSIIIFCLEQTILGHVHQLHAQSLVDLCY